MSSFPMRGYPLAAAVKLACRGASRTLGRPAMVSSGPCYKTSAGLGRNRTPGSPEKGPLLEPSVVRIVAHVDMDAFYAAVEERCHPELRGRPVVVGADPKGGRGRGVVTAANYAARKYGIRSALPISRAWRLAKLARRKGEPEAVFVRGDRSLYREVSGRIMAIIARGADAFEEASIDEAYVDLSSLGGMREAEAHARRLKGEILAQEGLTCSIGIGPNKLVAKIASDFQKPDGLTVVTADEVQIFLDALPIRVIPGIGPKTEALLQQAGIRTVAELRGLELATLRERFGKWGHDLYDRAR